MTEFIIRHFVKDYEDVQDNQVRTRYVAAASIVGFLCNILLFAGKLTSGIFMRSIAVWQMHLIICQMQALPSSVMSV